MKTRKNGTEIKDIQEILDKPSANHYNPDTNSFFIFDEIDQDLAEAINSVIDFCVFKGKKELNIFINSPGGDLFATVAIVSAMKRIKTNTFNMGFAASSAAIIFLAGDVRQCSPYSYVMFHEGSFSTEEGNMSSVKDFIVYIEGTCDLIMRDLLKKTKLPFKEYTKKIDNKDWYISAKEAIRLKIADRIMK